MDENIDVSKRKPRRTRGTIAYHYRNRFAAGIIAVGTALFGLWASTPIFRKATDRFIENSKLTEEDIDRRYLFNFSKPTTARKIKEQIEEFEKIKQR